MVADVAQHHSDAVCLRYGTSKGLFGQLFVSSERNHRQSKFNKRLPHKPLSFIPIALTARVLLLS